MKLIVNLTKENVFNAIKEAGGDPKKFKDEDWDKLFSTDTETSADELFDLLEGDEDANSGRNLLAMFYILANKNNQFLDV